MSQLHFVLDWIAAHPGWTLAVLFLCCVGESILILGVLIPTTLVLFAAGALVALGSLEFGAALGAAMAGAVVGDSINFWAGRYFGERALESHYARRYQESIARSRRLFERHGAKALVLARFIGLVRPFIAAIAGAYGMSLARFMIVEGLAALLWAAPLIGIGVVFGASLDLASEVAARLAILLAGVTVLTLLLVWLAQAAVSGLQRRAERWTLAVLDWSHRHRVVGRLGQWLADPDQPETPALVLIAAALLALGGLWVLLWWGWRSPAPAPTDLFTYLVMQDLRTPLTTALALALAALAQWTVYGSVALAVLITLLLTGRTRAAAHWLAAISFGAVFALGLHAALSLPSPIQYFDGPGTAGPGFDLVLAIIIYSFMPVLLSTGATQAARTAYYGLSATLVALMLAAQIYLGAVWLSLGVFALVSGTAWIALLGIGYRRHRPERILGRELLPVAVGVMVAAVTLQGSVQLRRGTDEAAREPRHLSASAWWNGAHVELPAYRVDAAGHEKQPLTVQWAGELAKIESALRAAGWESPPALSWDTGLRWLSANSPLPELPLLPQVHAGAHQALVLRLPGGDERQQVLRLWPTGVRVDRLPLWIGTLTAQTGHRVFRLVRYPRTTRDYDSPLQALSSAPPGFEVRRTNHPRREADGAAWSGTVLLLRPVRS